ncbi:nuclear transport factor 2 family protein [Vibrio sp. SCSIO 43136]|uniref:nuclear transport factor 2 family protein n=1 Tax=Vibrio sp. SCSIO 43136 TaxID=2819101 RepID=UPI00207523FE|nr:nuclear transport factor 2 family protein [Vibrio sp. SCSIO 43136]USD64033.1 nuclear transport factor 2 family protein [Vibrio sp. SCSIO 43136]
MNIKDHLIQLETDLHKYDVRSNLALCHKILHPEFEEVGRSGKYWNLSQIIQMMSEEQPSQDIIHSQNFNAAPLSDSVWMLNYETVVKSESGELSGFAKRSSIWVNCDDSWQLRYHQGTACEPFDLHI